MDRTLRSELTNDLGRGGKVGIVEHHMLDCRHFAVSPIGNGTGGCSADLGFSSVYYADGQGNPPALEPGYRATIPPRP